MKKKFIVVNSTPPELEQLAAALCEDDNLECYIGPYMNTGQRWERALSKISFFKNIYEKTLHKRVKPPSLEASKIVQCARTLDLGSAAIGLLSHQFAPTQPVAALLRRHCWDAVERRGAEMARRDVNVVASYSLARLPFRNANGKKFLNYSIAHHRYIKKFVTEEAELEPEFATTLPQWGEKQLETEEKLDEECALSDIIFVGSSFAKETFVQSGIDSDRLRVINYGTDIALFSPRLPQAFGRQPSRKVRLLFVGSIGQRKGISYLLKAFEVVRRPEIELVMVGSYFGSEVPFRQYKHLYTHIPHVSPAELSIIYKSSDIFVFPTLVEGLGLVVAEAMASGLPVIATPNGPEDIVRDGVDGFLVPPRDINALAERIDLLARDNDLRNEMGLNARKQAEQFSWVSYRERVKAFFESIN